MTIPKTVKSAAPGREAASDKGSGPEATAVNEYMNPDTGLPPYLPFPRFLLKADLSLTAKLVYTLLLDRMTLSQKNGWTDGEGHSYIIYPVERIAWDIDRSRTSVKSALTELTARGLIERRRSGFSAPNHIFVLLPYGRIPDCMTDGEQTVAEPETGPSEGWKTAPGEAGFPAPNQPSKNHTRNNKLKRERTLSVYGRYHNVRLGDEDYAALRRDNPRIDSLIEQLSAYMKSEGRTYADHAATLRLWMERGRGRGAPSIPDYTHKEGESL